MDCRKRTQLRKISLIAARTNKAIRQRFEFEQSRQSKQAQPQNYHAFDEIQDSPQKAKDSTDQRTSDVVGQNSAIACPAENTKALQNAVFPYEFKDTKCIVLVTYSIPHISHDLHSLKVEFETSSYRVRGETTDGNRFEIKRTI
uniref:Uncharacterized protein n=1 Tax=Ditylenchus dipsaci TaxID=166011 RepID=A0A915EL26_9BILA